MTDIALEKLYQAAVANGDIKNDPSQAVALEVLENLQLTLNATPKRSGLSGMFRRDGETATGVYLWGGVGRGKTMLMDMFLSAVMIPFRRVHFHSFMQEIHEQLHEARQSGADDALRPVAAKIFEDIRLLALDEMQINDITDAMIVGRLFDLLLAGGVNIVTTSNRKPDELYKDGLNRDLFLPFISLLNERLNVIELVSPTDHRQGQLAGRDLYFSPANSASVAAIDAIWADLADGEGAPLVLSVKGRETVLPRFSNGVARVQFWDICGAALGAADYLALADAARVLILENVPRLGRSNYNEAKRFVILIDALYEARVVLVMSAADIPERLYLEGAGAFEFERTASRLREMQSEGWGGNQT